MLLLLNRVALEPMALLVLRVLPYVSFILIFKESGHCKAKALTITQSVS